MTPGGTNPRSAGVNANLAWGRWTGGLTSAGLQAVHYVIGVPTPNINNLSGVHNFAVAGFSNPTVKFGGTVGAFEGVKGSLQANFDSSLVDLDFQVKFADADYSVTTPTPLDIGSDASFSGFPNVQGGPETASGPVTSCLFSTCNAAVQGFFSGKNGESAGLSYHIDDPAGAGDLTGVVVFDKKD